MDTFERIYVCAHSKCEDDEQDIISDFSQLEFGNNISNNTSDINYNDGQEANQFDKIAKYYGRGKNIFLFISLLKNEEFSKKIMDLIGEKCDSTQQAKFIERATLYLNRIKSGENDAKEFLFDDRFPNDESFPNAFFNGYHCGEKKNVHENLNVNFTSKTQFLNMACDNISIFDRTIGPMLKEKSFLRRVKIYDNGRRAVTILNDRCKRKYTFTSDSSCHLIIKNWATIFLDIIGGKIIHIDFEIYGKTTNPREILLEEKIMNNETILINQKSLKEVLIEYFDKEENIQRVPIFVQEECLPIKTLNDLCTWKPPKGKHVTERLRRNFVYYKEEEKERPKTLVCHDMRGGYLEDRFINGTNGENNYFFVHWQLVDIFVYFSHNFVTIPPCSWITAAHKNGVQILGTFITEWDEGSKICEEFFKDEETVHLLSMQLVQIALHYNFDGWLINIENKLKTCQIPLLKEFLSFLTSNMHCYCPGSQVIWYDSVLKNGELKWQNALNDSNRMFFVACDGIFLNYNWTDDNLLQSKYAAGDRKTDVYVGVDVFGRGCVGGGGFSTDIAVAKARKFGLSVAIFAPGWVYECLDVKDFKENQFKFWGSLQKFCLKESFMEVPFYSTFCPGFGKNMFRNGKVIANKPWFNLSLQSLQPIYSYQPINSCQPVEFFKRTSSSNPISSSNQGGTKGSIQLCDNDAFNGGGCICVCGEIRNEQPLELTVIHTASIPCNCIVSYTFKPLLFNTEMILVLTHPYGCLHLVGESTTIEETFKSHSVRPSSKEEVLLAGYTLNETLPKDEKWIKRIYVLTNNFDEVSGIVSAKLISTDKQISPSVSALLGELEIIPLKRFDLTCKDLKWTWDPVLWTKVNCVVEWKYHPSVVCSDIYVKADLSEECYIGTTSQCSYKLEHVFQGGVFAFTLILCPQSSGIEKFSSETKYILA